MTSLEEMKRELERKDGEAEKGGEMTSLDEMRLELRERFEKLSSEEVINRGNRINVDMSKDWMISYSPTPCKG